MVKQTVGTIIREKRRALGLTADNLGKRAGVNRTYVSKIENNCVLPSIRVALIIKKILGLDEIFMEIYYEAKYPDVIAFAKKNAYLIEAKQVKK